MKCRKGYEIVPQHSPAGYYLGTRDKEGFPNCRISQGYARTAKEAMKLPMDRQCAMENMFCNRGDGCF